MIWQYALLIVGLVAFIAGMIVVGYFVLPKVVKISETAGSLIGGLFGLAIGIFLLFFFGKTFLNMGVDTIETNNNPGYNPSYSGNILTRQNAQFFNR
jgi:hypothetical protein